MRLLVGCLIVVVLTLAGGVLGAVLAPRGSGEWQGLPALSWFVQGALLGGVIGIIIGVAYDRWKRRRGPPGN